MSLRRLLPYLALFVLVVPFGAGCVMNVAEDEPLLAEDEETMVTPKSHADDEPPPCMTELRQTVGGRTLRVLIPCARRRSWIRFPFYPVGETRR